MIALIILIHNSICDGSIGRRNIDEDIAACMCVDMEKATHAADNLPLNQSQFNVN